MYLHFLETPLKPNFNYIFNKWQNSGWIHAVHQRVDKSGYFFFIIIIIFLAQILLCFLCFLASISWISSSRERRFAFLMALNSSGPSRSPFVFTTFIQTCPRSLPFQKSKGDWPLWKATAQDEFDSQMWTWSSVTSQNHYSFKISISNQEWEKRHCQNTRPKTHT